MTKTTRDKVYDAADSVKPYVERAMRDEQLRRDVSNAFMTARGLYDELVGARSPVTVANRVATDDEVRDRLKTAVEDLRSAANRLQGKQERSHRGRKTLLIAGIALGILFNPVTGPETRRWLKDAIGGGSDDFGGDYSSNGGAT
jgi:tetrahydromethanopterin S-methyltransferase subunit F